MVSGCADGDGGVEPILLKVVQAFCGDCCILGPKPNFAELAPLIDCWQDCIPSSPSFWSQSSPSDSTSIAGSAGLLPILLDERGVDVLEMFRFKPQARAKSPEDSACSPPINLWDRACKSPRSAVREAFIRWLLQCLHIGLLIRWLLQCLLIRCLLSLLIRWLPQCLDIGLLCTCRGLLIRWLLQCHKPLAQAVTVNIFDVLQKPKPVITSSMYTASACDTQR